MNICALCEGMSGCTRAVVLYRSVIGGKVSSNNRCKPTFPYLPSNRAPFNVVKNAIVKLRGNTAIPQRLGAEAPLLTSF